jgi:Cupin-like domain
MNSNAGISAMQRMAFNAMFSADWLLGHDTVSKVLPRRWARLNHALATTASRNPEGRAIRVDRRSDLTPREFKEKYYLPGIPVVFAGAAENWPAVRKWTPDYLRAFCGSEQIPVLDGQNWKVNPERGREVVSTSENMLAMSDLLNNVKTGGAWYGAFIELFDKYPKLREDLDLSFVSKFGHTNGRIPWHRNVLAKMYVGGAGTATSLHCAGVSNLYVQVYGQKKWVLIAPEFTPFMYPASSRGLNFQSRVDFRDPSRANCSLYRFVDRFETVLEPGDILWNPPFVWHGVANITESIAVSLWWVNVTRGFRSNCLLSALTLCARPNPIAIQLGFSSTKKSASSHFGVHLNK